MSKALVVYGTGTGCTAEIAERMGVTLTESGANVEVYSADGAPRVDGYEVVLVGSGVRAGSWHKSAKEWVVENADALKTAKVAFFSVGLTLATAPWKTDEVRAYTDKLIAETGVEPFDIGMFAGCNKPKQFKLAERTIMALMKAPEGDFRDWDAIDAWTREVAERVLV